MMTTRILEISETSYEAKSWFNFKQTQKFSKVLKTELPVKNKYYYMKMSTIDFERKCKNPKYLDIIGDCTSYHYAWGWISITQAPQRTTWSPYSLPRTGKPSHTLGRAFTHLAFFTRGRVCYTCYSFHIKTFFYLMMSVKPLADVIHEYPVGSITRSKSS